MGELEKQSRKRTSKLFIQKAILGSIATVGILAVAVVAPNALRVLKSFGIYRPKTNPKYQLNKTFFSLIDQGYLFLEKSKKGTFARLTDKGTSRLYVLGGGELKNRQPKKWDGKWRVLIFDIREARRGKRDLLRITLQSVGFVRLQNSVWVYPYDCEDFITLLKADFKLGREVVYMIVDQIENDRTLREKFNLYS